MSLTTETQIVQQSFSNRSYNVSQTAIQGYVKDLEALSQAIHKRLATQQFEYPIYYDVEGKMLNNSRDVLTNIVIAFCDRCEKAGYFVGVYTSDSHFQAHVDDDRLQRFTHWVARYSSNEP